MASLVLRGITWHVTWRWRGKQKSKSTKVRHDGRSKDGLPVPPAAAKRELRRLQTELLAGRSFDSKTLPDLLALVEKEYATAGYSSARSLKSRLEHIRDFFGSLRADRIEEADFADYAEARQRPRHGKPGASNATINRELEVVMRALRLGKIHPLPRFKKLPEAAPRQGFFDDTQITAVTLKLPAYLRGPVLFGYYCGWRREEVFGLEWSAVDFNAGEIRLWDSKNDRPRVFPMDAVPPLRALLEAQRPKDGDLPSPLVFPRRFKKRKAVRRIVDFRKAFESACSAAGCPGRTFHDLRRSAARNLELAGWPRSLIMSWMGHETEAMFHRYRIVSAADRAVVVKLLASRLEEGSK